MGAMAEFAGLEVFRQRPVAQNKVVQKPVEFRDESRKTAHLGFSALLLATGLLALVAYAVFAALDGDFERATLLAWIAVGGSILTGLMGLAALVLGYGRLWGLAAVVVSLLANPFALRAILGFFGDLAATQ